MVLDGSFGENKSFGDLGVRQPTGDEFGHYAFTASEYRQRLISGVFSSHRCLRDARIDHHPTVNYRMQCSCESLDRCVFREEVHHCLSQLRRGVRIRSRRT